MKESKQYSRLCFWWGVNVTTWCKAQKMDFTWHCPFKSTNMATSQSRVTASYQGGIWCVVGWLPFQGGLCLVHTHTMEVPRRQPLVRDHFHHSVVRGRTQEGRDNPSLNQYHININHWCEIMSVLQLHTILSALSHSVRILKHSAALASAPCLYRTFHSGTRAEPYRTEQRSSTWGTRKNCRVLWDFWLTRLFLLTSELVIYIHINMKQCVIVW